MDKLEQLKKDPKKYYDGKVFQVHLSSRQIVNNDTYLFTFQMMNNDDSIKSIISENLIIYGQNMNGECVMRKYTVISPNDQKGTFDILIKIYRANEEFYSGGELTPWLEQIQIGQKLIVKRTMSKLIYFFNGECILKPKINKLIRNFNTILMCCGGTGITPMYQLIQAICQNDQDKTQIYLLSANRTENDILLREKIERFAIQFPNKFQAHFTIDQLKSTQNWRSFVGFINLEMMKKCFPSITESTLGIYCGPKGFNKLANSLYKELGLPESQILKF